MVSVLEMILDIAWEDEIEELEAQIEEVQEAIDNLKD